MIKQRGIQFFILIFILSLFVTGCVDYSGSYDDYIGSGNLTDSEAVNSVASNFSTDNFVFAPGDSINSVREDFTVPVTGDYDTSISWISTDSYILNYVPTNSIHVMNRPSTGDMSIILTATISRGNESVSVDVQVTVMAEVWQYLMEYRFLADKNDYLDETFEGSIVSIDDFHYDITVALPLGTPVTNLVASFPAGYFVDVAGVPQVSDVTGNDFSDPVFYNVSDVSANVQQYKVVIQYY